MKKVYWVSLCYEGAHGGGLYVLGDHLQFRTNKIQLPDNVKNITIPFSEVAQITKSRSLHLFPAILITLRSGVSYKFILLRRTELINYFQKRKMEGVQRS